jgi:hypothetical protein
MGCWAGRSRQAGTETMFYNLSSLDLVHCFMKPLTQYGRLAERHWREFLPRMVAQLEAKGLLQTMLLEAEEKTDAELDALRRQFIQQGIMPATRQADGQWVE